MQAVCIVTLLLDDNADLYTSLFSLLVLSFHQAILIKKKKAIQFDLDICHKNKLPLIST